MSESQFRTDVGREFQTDGAAVRWPVSVANKIPSIIICLPTRHHYVVGNRALKAAVLQNKSTFIVYFGT